MSPPKESEKAFKLKPKSKHLPVLFEEFCKLIENLPDIELQVQCDLERRNGDAKKTLDECALWYYNAFYKDASVRERYPFKVCACPQRLKDKLLTMPEAEEEFENEPADGVTVTADKMGKFLFPVTYDTFKKYANKKKIRKYMKHKQKSATAGTWHSQKGHRIRRFYYYFYMFPQERKSTNVFPKAPEALKAKLWEFGHPIDESAVTSLAKHKKLRKKLKRRRNPKKSSKISIASFEEFQKYLANLYDIVWQLKLNDPEYVALGFEDCAYAYYLAFYRTPEIRERYKYTLKPCTPDIIIARVLAIPSPKEAKKLGRTLPELFRVSPDLEQPKSPDSVTGTESDRSTDGCKYFMSRPTCSIIAESSGGPKEPTTHRHLI